jgi:hypothetical protein
VILASLIVAGGIAVVLALGWSLVAAGLRAGDRAGDATVTAAADVGVVPATSQAEFRLPVAAPARRYRLTAVVGQAGGRLRVVRIPVVSGGWSAGAGRPARAARAGDPG